MMLTYKRLWNKSFKNSTPNLPIKGSIFRSLSRAFSTKNGKVHLAYTHNNTLTSTKQIKENVTLFLHGYFGSRHEWHTIASDRRVLELTNTYALDAANHGDSMPSKKMGFDDQARHVIEFADRMEIDKFWVVGHSMGGRAAMRVALSYPDRVQAVMSVDSPACSFVEFPGYADKTYQMSKFFKNFDPSGKTIQEVKSVMASTFGNDPDFLKRIERNFWFSDEQSTDVKWIANPQNLFDDLASMYEFPATNQYNGPASMLVNEKSKRFRLEHYSDWFPKLTEKDIHTIPNTGHWVHTDNPEATINHIITLLHSIQT